MFTWPGTSLAMSIASCPMWTGPTSAALNYNNKSTEALRKTCATGWKCIQDHNSDHRWQNRPYFFINAFSRQPSYALLSNSLCTTLNIITTHSTDQIFAIAKTSASIGFARKALHRPYIIYTLYHNNVNDTSGPRWRLRTPKRTLNPLLLLLLLQANSC